MLYLAPEAITSLERGIKPASEVWSLGVTLYVLATGRYPFLSKEAICETGFDWPEAPPLSQNFKSMIASMLKKDQELRLSLDELLQAPWFRESQESPLEVPAVEAITD